MTQLNTIPPVPTAPTPAPAAATAGEKPEWLIALEQSRVVQMVLGLCVYMALNLAAVPGGCEIDLWLFRFDFDGPVRILLAIGCSFMPRIVGSRKCSPAVQTAAAKKPDHRSTRQIGLDAIEEFRTLGQDVLAAIKDRGPGPKPPAPGLKTT